MGVGMKNYLIKGFKRSIVCFIIFSLTIPTFSSRSYAGYGISIDLVEDRNLPLHSIRVLFLDIDKQKVEEVNYYAPLDREDHYSYIIPEGVQHKENPLLAFVFNNKVLQEIVVKDGFTTDQYTVISKFPFHKAGDEDRLPFTNNADRYYQVVETPRNLSELSAIKTPKKYRPTFHYIDPKIDLLRKDNVLEKALGGEQGNAKNYTKHKEKLGEYATLLTLLEYGYTKIYDTKLGQTGMDFMAFSGDDPSKDIFVLVESKWTSDGAASLSHLDEQLNTNKIISRLKLLSQDIAPFSIEVMKNVKAFFSAKESKICKFLYKIFDKKNAGGSKGVAKPALKAIEEPERIEIATKVGIINPPTSLVASMGTLSISSETPANLTIPIRNPGELLSFIGFLKEKNVDLNAAFLFFEKEYSTYHKEYSTISMNMYIDELISSFNPTINEDDTKEEEGLSSIKDVISEVKSNRKESLSTDGYSTSEDGEFSDPRKRLLFDYDGQSI